jgi:hypothetical protein
MRDKSCPYRFTRFVHSCIEKRLLSVPSLIGHPFRLTNRVIHYSVCPYGTFWVLMSVVVGTRNNEWLPYRVTQ